jgi:hypothetical protein
VKSFVKKHSFLLSTTISLIIADAVFLVPPNNPFKLLLLVLGSGFVIYAIGYLVVDIVKSRNKQRPSDSPQ